VYKGLRMAIRGLAKHPREKLKLKVDVLTGSQ